MADNFTANFLAGAQVGNMLALRREREQELRSQDALRQIQERNLVQQISQRAQLFQQKQAEDQADNADLAAYNSILHEQLDQRTAAAQDLNPDEQVDTPGIAKDIISSTLPAFAAKNPRAASKFVKAVAPVLADQSREEVAALRASRGGANAAFEPHVGVAKGPNGEEFQYFQESPNKAKMITKDGALGETATPVSDPDGNQVGFMVGKHFVSKASAQTGAASPASKALVQGWTDQIKQLNKKMNALEGDDATTEGHRLDIRLQISNLEKRITSTLGGKSGKTATVAPTVKKKLRFVPGKGLIDASQAPSPAPDQSADTEGE